MPRGAVRCFGILAAFVAVLSLGGLALGGLALAGCAAGGAGPAAPASGPSPTVSTGEVSGVGTVLVDSAGSTLYVAEQESDGRVRCTGGCLRIWRPLTVPAGAVLAAGPGVTGSLATVTRPDGSVQVSYRGRPLYLFQLDHGPGQAAGNGTRDHFAGTGFVWHAATASGAAPSSSPDDGGYSG